MRGLWLLQLLLIVSLLSAEITVFASQIPDTGAVRYSILQSGVNDGHLQLILRKGDTQITVTDIQNFNGAAGGFLSPQEAGTYRLVAYEETTGEYGETEFEFVLPQPTAPPAEEGQQIIRGVPDYLFWLALIVAAIIIFLIVFGNPLAQEKAKKKAK